MQQSTLAQGLVLWYLRIINAAGDTLLRSGWKVIAVSCKRALLPLKDFKNVTGMKKPLGMCVSAQTVLQLLQENFFTRRKNTGSCCSYGA